MLSVRYGTNDDQLVIRMLADDFQAMAEFLERFGRLIWKRIVSLYAGRDAADQQDAHAEVMLHLWTVLARYSGGTLQAWVNRIVINKVFDLNRRRQSRVGNVRDALIEQVADSEPGPAAAAIEAEQLAMLRGAIEQLSPEDRELLELRLAGNSISDIAEANAQRRGWGLRNLKYRLARIQEQLLRKTQGE